MLRCYNSTRLTNLMSSFSVINEYFQNIEIEVNSTNQCNIIAGSSYGLFSCTGTNMVDSRFPNFPYLSYSSCLSPSIQNQSVGNKKNLQKICLLQSTQPFFFPPRIFSTPSETNCSQAVEITKFCLNKTQRNHMIHVQSTLKSS